MSTLYPLEGFLIQAEGSRPTPQTIARALQAAHALTPFSECRVAKRWVPADFSVEGITEALASTRFGPILWELAGNATSYVSYAWDWLQVPYAYATLKLHLSGPTPKLMTADAVLNSLLINDPARPAGNFSSSFDNTFGALKGAPHA